MDLAKRGLLEASWRVGITPTYIPEDIQAMILADVHWTRALLRAHDVGMTADDIMARIHASAEGGPDDLR